MKKNFDERIFELGIFLLPFENFFFAPSRGWAAISPILFFLYLLLNIKNVKLFKLVLFFLLGICISMINYILVGYNYICFRDSILTLTLGLSFLYSSYIYYTKTKSINRIINIIVFTYSISFVVGIIQFIAIKYNISAIYNLYDLISMRSYMHVGRPQFTFTEPSFISMHIYGVLLPLFLISKDKRIIKLIIIFAIFAILFGSGMRILLDTFVILTIVYFYYIKSNKKRLIISILLLPMIICGLYYGYNYSYENNIRFKNIVDKGSNGDPSAATRSFRIKSAIYGYKNNPLHLLIGYGLGNSSIAIHDGYEDALYTFDNNYTFEIDGLRYSYDENATYCLYIRLISEYGIIWFILFFYLIFKLYKKSTFQYKSILFISILYLYIQFDSYGFYAFWLCLLILFFTGNKQPTNELII